MNFEQLVRPVMGEDYDTRFPARSTATPDLNAELSEAEAAFIADWARLYSAASNLGSVEKIRHSLIGALKTIRRDAEARKKSELALAARGGRLKYRFRVIAPDGDELMYPSNGTIHANRIYAMLSRAVRPDPILIRRHVENYYAPYLTKARANNDTAREAALLEACERDVAGMNSTFERRSYGWRVREDGSDRRRLEREMARIVAQNDSSEIFLPSLYQYEYVIVEGTPFPV